MTSQLRLRKNLYIKKGMMLGRPSGGSPVGPPVMPSGMLASWYADTYVSSPRPAIVNQQNLTPASANLLSAPRRLFSNVEFWSGNSTTITDEVATAPDGSSEASTIVGTGNWFMHLVTTDTLPAGTYTLAVNAKRNTTSDQPFALSSDNTATRHAFTATSAWQRFAFTFTPFSQNLASILLCSVDGTTGANIQICDLELFPGAADLGPELLAGHLYPGDSAFDTTAPYAGGWLNISANGRSLIQMPATTTIANFSVIAIVEKIGSSSGYSGILSKVQSYGSFTVFEEQSSTQALSFSGAVSLNQMGSGLWNLTGRGAHAIGATYDGTTAEFWIDDVMLIAVNAPSLSAVPLRDMFVGAVNNAVLTSGYRINSIAIWNRALASAEWRTAFTVLKTRAAVSGITVTPVSRVYVAEGDSITGGFSYSYPYVFGPNSSPAVLGADVATSGAVLANMVTRSAVVDSIIPPTTSGRKFILSVLIGANDLGGYPTGAAGYIADLAAYCDARRAAGWKVVVCTILPKSGDATHNSRRATVNSAITGGWIGVHCNAIADFAADPTMGPDAAASNTTYYADGEHPTSAGQVILETIIRPAINAL